MTRPPSDPVARLPRLLAARKAIGRKSVTLNMAEMAEVVGLTSRRFTQIVKGDDALPVVKRGSEGIPWEFDAARVLDHLIATARAAQAERERRKARVSRLAGLEGADAGSSSPAGAGHAGGSGTAAREMLEQARAYSEVIDLRARLRSEKAKDGLLIDRGEVERFLWRWLSGLQAEVLAIEQRIDKAGKMEPAQRQMVKDELAAILVRLREQLERFIGDAGDGDDRGGPGASRPGPVPRKDRGHRAARAGAAHTA